MPIQRIVVATDLSEQAGMAVRRAAELATRHHALVVAVHVVPAGLDAELTGFARTRLRSHVDEYADSSVVEPVVRHGPVVREIAAEVVEQDADLLVVGAHGAHGLADAFLGSTPANLVRVSPVPVLVVKNHPRRGYRKVMLAVDTSPAAAAAARTGFALTPDADHVLVHGDIVLGETLLRLRGTDDDHLAELRRVSTKQARADIERVAATLFDIPPRVVIESGRPHTLLPDLARRYGTDLVVVGTGSHSTFGYALLGSVAQHVLRHAPSDVLVVSAVKG